MTGTQSARPSRNRLNLKSSHVDSGDEYHGQSDAKQHRSTRSSRRDRVHPEGRRSSRGMDEGEESHRGGKSTVHSDYDEDRQYSPSSSKGIRSSSDLRSPGGKKTPIAMAAAAGKQSNGQSMPDFITQTDANGNYTTPRSSAAINGARKAHPSGPRPHLHVDKRGHPSYDNNGDGNGDKAIYARDDPCDALFETLRTMCCCFMDDSKTVKYISGKPTEDSDDPPKLLGDLHPDDSGKKCLVLDLDETLVHSSFRAVPNADFVIPVQIEDVVHFVYVIKRPGVDEFLIEMAKHYELVIYTASLNKYADPLLDLLDPKRVIRTRLFRESCVYYQGSYVKDLSLLDRHLRDTIIIDNSPNSYMFHPENAIDCSSFIDDPRDRELEQIGSFLKGIKDANDVRGVAPQWRNWPDVKVAESQHEEAHEHRR